jgi:hypothetical protein
MRNFKLCVGGEWEYMMVYVCEQGIKKLRESERERDRERENCVFPGAAGQNRGPLYQ